MYFVDEILLVFIVMYYLDKVFFVWMFFSFCVVCVCFYVVCGGSVISVCVIDNGGLFDFVMDFVVFEEVDIWCSVLFGYGNVGYGCGYNFVIIVVCSCYYLILNFDIDFEMDIFL